MMKKIAHFIDSLDPGGAESIVIELCLQERRRNLAVVVLHFGNPWLEMKCKELGIDSIRVPFYNLYKSKYTILLFSILFAFFLRIRKIDLVHTHLFDPVIATTPASFISRIPHVATLHDIYSIEHNKNRHRILKMAVMLNTRIVSVSNQIIIHLNEYGILGKDSISLIRNGVNLEKYTPRLAERYFPPELGVNTEDVVIISVGRLVPIKGHINLFKSFYAMAQDIPCVKLVIIGDGPEMNNLTHFASKLGISDKILFLGHRDDVSVLLQQSDIFALASLSEGLSCSIIEAMASGLPIVATDVGGNNELVKDHVNGYLIPEGDIDMFGKRLSELVNNRDKRLMYAGMSVNRARTEFSTESMSVKYIQLYSDLLGNNK